MYSEIPDVAWWLISGWLMFHMQDLLANDQSQQAWTPRGAERERVTVGWRGGGTERRAPCQTDV